MSEHSQQLNEIMANCHVVKIHKDHTLYKEFGSALQDQTLNDIECLCGDAPELSEGDTMAIYFPKDIDDPAMYDDPADDKQVKQEFIELCNKLIDHGEVVL